MEHSVLEKEIRGKNIRLLTDEPMSRHTSFRIGGPAKLLALPQTEDELIWLCGLTASPLVIGNGTNLLVTDGPIDRLVVVTTGMCDVRRTDRGIEAASGALLSRTAVFAMENGLAGLEFAHGIPGTLGGAVMMNAGAYGGEMADAAVETRFLNEKLELCRAVGGEQGFAYRESAFSDKNCVILSAVLELRQGDRAEIKARMEELMAKRKASQPLDRPSAGSTFKRPKTGYAAALIDEAGLKGFGIGGAQVSEKHAGFVINRGGATCEDVLRLMEHIRKTVFDRSGVELTPEVRVIGG